jgi:hypothetical protein
MQLGGRSEPVSQNREPSRVYYAAREVREIFFSS